MSALHEAFAKAKSENRAALIAYLPAGFPNVEAGYEIARAVVDGGADIVEVGWPYSDPLMDGPTIQKAVELALANGAKFTDVLNTVSVVSDAGAVALVMSYWNPIERVGLAKFASELAAAGGVGVITPDITPEEATQWIKVSDEHQLDRIFLVAPSSTEQRIKIVTEACSGFVYAASLMGVTGTRSALSSHAEGLVQRTRAVTDLPVAVGLGVSTAEQAATVAQYADGVIVGSAFVQAVLDAPTEAAAIVAVRKLAAELAAGVRRK